MSDSTKSALKELARSVLAAAVAFITAILTN